MEVPQAPLDGCAPICREIRNDLREPTCWTSKSSDTQGAGHKVSYIQVICYREVLIGFVRYEGERIDGSPGVGCSVLYVQKWKGVLTKLRKTGS